MKNRRVLLSLAAILLLSIGAAVAQQQQTGLSIPLRVSKADAEATATKCSADLEACLKDLTTNHRLSQVREVSHEYEVDEDYPLLTTALVKRNYWLVKAVFNGSRTVSDKDLGWHEDISLLTLNVFTVTQFLNQPNAPKYATAGWGIPNDIILGQNQIAVLSKGGQKNYALPGGRQVLVSQRPDISLTPGREVILILSFVQNTKLAILPTGGNDLYYLSQYGRDEKLMLVNPVWTQGDGVHPLGDCPESIGYIQDEGNWGTFLSKLVQYMNTQN